MNPLHIILMSALFATATHDAGSDQRTSSYPPAWPRAGAVKLMENDRVAAYEVRYEVGRPSILHQHRYPFVGLDLATTTIKVTDLDGKDHVFPVTRGNMWFLPRGAIHTEMSTSAPARHLIAIDIKDVVRPDAANLTSYPAASFAIDQKKVIDNDRVTIWNCGWRAGASGSKSFFARDVVMVFATTGAFAMSGVSGRAQVRRVREGQTLFLPAGTVRALSAVRGELRAMVVELK